VFVSLCVCTVCVCGLVVGVTVGLCDVIFTFNNDFVVHKYLINELSEEMVLLRLEFLFIIYFALKDQRIPVEVYLDKVATPLSILKFLIFHVLYCDYPFIMT